ncbi:MAG: large repetitive protein [Ilumatobacteraceae bacterium]
MGTKRVGICVAALSCVVSALPVVVAPLGGPVVFAAAPPQYIVGTPNDLTSGASCTAGVATSSCSLRAAVAAANASSGATITVPAGTYLLNGGSGSDTGDLDLTKPMTIVGAGKPNGSAATSIVGSGDRVFDLASTATAVTVRGVRISGGNAGNNPGGGIRTVAGTNLNLVESTVSGNSAKEGAGVHNSGTLTVERSTLSGNTTSGKGGGLFNAGTATVRNSTVNTNAAGGGGGIASSGTVLILHSNITSNNSNNSNGGGIYRVGGAFTLKSSIVADNNAPSARDCYGTPTFQGVNLVESTPGCNPAGTVIQLDPALDPLADNGGPTLTQMPRLGSPVIDATPCDPAILIDQRNTARPFGAACDLGAVELAPLSFSVSLAATPAQVNVGVQTVPIANIPTSVLATAYPSASTSSTADTALGRIALGRIALGRIDVKNSALGRIALGRIMLDDLALGRISLADTALTRILITEVNVEGGWEALLLGTALANVPLQTLSMADVLADPIAGPRLQALDLTKLDVSSTLLGEIPLVLFAFAGQTFNTLPPDSSSSVPALDQWAAILGVPAVDLSGRTPLSTALVRVDVSDAALGRIALGRIDLLASALGRIALGRIDVDNAALGRIALGRIDIANTALGRIALGRIALDSTALGRIALGRIALGRIDIAGSGLANVSLGGLSAASLATFLDCTKVNCTTGTLGQAAASGAILSTATIATLILALEGTASDAQIGDLLTAANQAMTADGIELADLLRLLAGSPLAGFTLADLFPALFADADLPWQDIDLEATPLQNLGSPLVAPATFTTTITVANATPNVSIALSLPSGFAAVPGSASFDANGSAAPPPVTLALPAVTVAGATLTFNLGAVPPGTHTLTVQARAGIRTGVAQATVNGTATAGAITKTSSSTAEIEVVENPDSSFGPLSPDSLYVGHLVSSGDDDMYTTTFQVTPQQAADGRKASVYLSNLAADYDLAVFGPKAASLRGQPVEGFIPVDDHQIGVDPTSEAVAPDSQFDIPLSAPAGSGLLGVSANRSNTPERVDLGDLRAGTYTIQVSGYNGAFSDLPFTLRVRTQSLGLPPCTASAFGAKSTAAVAPTLPAGMDTLFVVPTNRLRQLWGDADTTALTNRLQTFVTARPGGVVAGILPVDASYGTWDANRCSPDAANDVARQIGAAIDAVKATNPTLQHLVLIGDDTALPFFRVSDGTATANEANYAEGFTGNNRLVGSLARGYIQTDDPYATARGISLSGRELFVPELAVGRLVESKADIVKALDTFTQYNGQLDPATTSSALVTGYDFLTDGSDAIGDKFAADGFATTRLINETWTTANLTNAFVSADPDIASINAHFDHNRALPADQNAAGTQSDLFTPTDLPTDDRFANGLFLSMGCHGGLSVSDIELGVSADSVDWAQSYSGRGAQWISNTGFGYGDTELVAYSERLMALFAKDLAVDGSLTTGQALSLAKRDYAKTTQVWSPYDEKALQEVVHYGLPMYRIAAAPGGSSSIAAPAAAASPTQGLVTTPDPITSVPSASVTLTMTGAVRNDVGAQGSFYSLDGDTLQVKDRPVEPLSVTDVHIASTDPAAGRQPHGALISALTSHEVQSAPGVIEAFKPYIDHPVIDRAASEVLRDTTGDAIFPATLARATGSIDGSGLPVGTLLFSAGQFRPTAPGIGQQRLFDTATVQVLYGTGDDFLSPTIETTRGALVLAGSTQTVGFDVDTDATARRVVVLFKGRGDHVWRTVDLVDTDPRADVSHWTGGAVVPAALADIEFFSQACDDNGNCSTSDNKASNFVAVRALVDADLSVNAVGAMVNGWFVSPPVQATIVGADATCAIEYNLDGAGWVDYLGGTISITGEGIHLLAARDDCGNSSLAVIPIDTKAPIVTASATPAPTATWSNSATAVTLNAIDPGGSGVASISYRINQGAVQLATGESTVVTVTAEGTTTITYSSTDAAGNKSADATITVRIDTASPTTSASVTSGTLGNNGWYTNNPTVTISASDPASGVASIDWSTALPAFTTVPNSAHANPFTTNVPVTAEGTTTVTYNALDVAGNRSANASIAVKIDRTGPTFSCPINLSTWYGANQTVTCTANDAVSGLATSSSFTLSTAVSAGTETASALTNTAQLCDVAGNCTTAGPLTLKIDLKAPTVACTPPPTAPWYAANVNVPCTAVDGGSGLATTSPSTFALATSVATGSASVAASTSSRTVTDVAGNSFGAGPYGPYKVDLSPPTIVITTPAPNATYPIGSIVTPVFSCADVGSGIAAGSCTGSSATLDTATPGQRTFTVTAVDVAGNRTTLSSSYNVGYLVCLQYDPTKPAPLGGTMVIKLQLCNAAGVNLSSPSIAVVATLIDGSMAPPPNFQGGSNLGNAFRFSSGSYIYNLDTSQLPTIGVGPHSLGFTVNGVGTYAANFTLK